MRHANDEALVSKDKHNIISDAGKTGEYSSLGRAYSSFGKSMQDVTLAYSIRLLNSSGNIILHTISHGMNIPSRGMNIHLFSWHWSECCVLLSIVVTDVKCVISQY